MNFQTLLDRLGKFLNIFHSLLVGVMDLLNNFERSMGLAEDFVGLLILRLHVLLLYLHAVVSSFGTLNVEVNVAILLVTLDNCSTVDALFPTDNATDVKL